MTSSTSGWNFDPKLADENGLVGVGADLEPQTLLDAYAHGVFPTRFAPYSDPRFPMFWWSPDPRAIIELNELHVSRRLARTWRRGRFQITFDHDFDSVLRACGDRGDEGTWLTADMIEAYLRLHHLGFAHSVEVWREGQLVGGTYGVALGGLFAAESMFHRVNDASKIALIALANRLRERNFVLWDIQLLTDHTERMGAIEISRDDYLERLQTALQINAKFN